MRCRSRCPRSRWRHHAAPSDSPRRPGIVMQRAHADAGHDRDVARRIAATWTSRGSPKIGSPRSAAAGLKAEDGVRVLERHRVNAGEVAFPRLERAPGAASARRRPAHSTVTSWPRADRALGVRSIVSADQQSNGRWARRSVVEIEAASVRLSLSRRRSCSASDAVRWMTSRRPPPVEEPPRSRGRPSGRRDFSVHRDRGPACRGLGARRDVSRTSAAGSRGGPGGGRPQADGDGLGVTVGAGLGAGAGPNRPGHSATASG